MLTDDELQDAIDDLVAELPDQVTIRFEDGTTLDPDTLEEVPDYTNRHTGLPALLVVSTQAEKVVETADGHSVLSFYEVTVPMVYESQSTATKVGDQVLVTLSHDNATQGAVLTVKDVGAGSLSISRRLLCQLEQS